jgi:hypothetical protein
MPATFFTFGANTGGIPAANFTFLVGAVPPGSFIMFMWGATAAFVAPTDSAGDVLNAGGAGFYVINSIGDPAYTINMNNPIGDVAVLGFVLTNPDNILGPFDQECDVTASCNPPASLTHDTTVGLCGGDTPGPITPLFLSTILVLFAQTGPGGSPVPVFPTPAAATLSDPVAGEFFIAVVNPAPIAPYNAFITTALTGDVILSLWDFVFISSGPPPGNPIFLSSLGVG